MRIRGSLRSKASLAAALAVAGAAWGILDYLKWRSLGPGGLPANLRGWVTMTRFRFLKQNEIDVRPLRRAVVTACDLSGWSNVRRRPGKRPRVSPYPIPHRQSDQLPDAAVRGALKELFDRKVREHADRVHYSLSHFEKRHPAITLRDSSGTVGEFAHGEIAHIHPSDSSMHLILSPTDAIAAIEMGWAQRHGLAGIAVGLPLTYVMVYAPREEEDLGVVAELIDAAISFASQSTR